MASSSIGWALLLWAGATLLLGRARWFSRPNLSERLRPYTAGGTERPPRQSVLSGAGDRLSRALHPFVQARDPVHVRLERLHLPLDANDFRMRQLGWSLAALAGALVVVGVTRPPPMLGAFVVLASPFVAFGAVDRRLKAASDQWREQLVLELPVVAEQLAMLLSAGFSLGAGLGRLAERGYGSVAHDLARVCSRVRQGLSEAEALREWAEIADVPALDRLLPVLALNREAADLGRLLATEARGIRKDLQRQLVETAERRAQQVWIPVTVAALVPGVAFLVVPFLEALRLYSSP
ncbi:MAG: type II secretion system F family protein [Acidimicrobiales bacterium]